MAQKIQKIHFIPLESDPSLFTQLINGLGVHSLEFQDVLSLDSADLLPTGCFALPEPVYALVLIYPTPEDYEAQLAAERREEAPYAGCGLEEPVIWFDQTIHNACGLYAILHAVSNIGPTYIDRNSVLGEFIPSCVGLDPTARAAALEASVGIADAYRAIAMQGGTPVPRAEDEVDFHYVCFVKSPLNGHLYEMDGDRNGPLDRGDGEILNGGLELAKSFIQQGNARFQLMALVPKTA
ncbi:ubiquitin carboxyl-terminal hydrolase [Mycena crocata]|nr:ubiquitin carboxyl-terminal hydrolase [Mycena crocata]